MKELDSWLRQGDRLFTSSESTLVQTRQCLSARLPKCTASHANKSSSTYKNEVSTGFPRRPVHDQRTNGRQNGITHKTLTVAIIMKIVAASKKKKKKKKECAYQSLSLEQMRRDLCDAKQVPAGLCHIGNFRFVI